MHFTRRRPDRHASHLLFAISIFAAGGAAASCSSSESDGPGPESGDLHTDAATEAPDSGVDAPRVAAGAVVPTPLPIVCASPPCATALVTTLGATVDDRSEGFCALLTDGTVACWGANGAGQLGRGDDAGETDSSSAARVLGLPEIASLDHTCAVAKNGEVWCWGTGPFLRQANASAVTTERTPVKLDLPSTTKVAVGYTTACAVVDGGAHCWGSNANAQLGPLPTAAEDQGLPRAMPLPPGAPIRSMAVGKATFVLREDGTLVTWGANPPLGRVSPIFPDPYPELVELSGLTSVSLAHDNACAAAGGVGYCWGAPAVPGKGSAIDRAIPEPIVTPEPIVDIATTQAHVVPNLGLKRSRWCATSISGAVFCWGLNESGQAGDGTQDYALEPVRVEGLPQPAAQVRTTPNTTCALLTNGKIYCWGSNYNGQLGNG